MIDTKYYIKQQLPNTIKSLGGEDIEVEQTIYFRTLQSNLGEPFESEHGLPQFIVEYSLIYTKNGNMVPELKNKVKPKTFTNNDLLYQRSFEPETLFEPILNPDYVEGVSNPDEQFLTMGAIDFIYGELINNEEHPERIMYLIPFLKRYVLDNYNDGWFDSSNLH